MTRPLDGLVVVAVEQAVAAPLATRHLVDLGARVIKVERVGEGDFARHYDSAIGDGCSSWFGWLNRGKESVALDLKSPTGRATLHRLVAVADVFMSNLAPGAVDRLGCGHEALHARHPRLVTCALSGYGADGPYRARKAYDLLIQAEAGLLALTGTADQMVKAGMSVADIAGGMYAYSGILAALLQRVVTGAGSHVAVSLFDALVEWLSHQIILTDRTGSPPKRAGARHATIAPYGPYACRDGSEVVIAVQSAGEWTALCTAFDLGALLEDERFATNERRVANSIALDARVDERLATLDCDEVIARLEGAGLAWSRVNGIDGMLEHEQLTRRARWITVEAAGTTFRTVRPPVDLGGSQPVIGAVPDLGEHTTAVLAWLDRIEQAGTEAGPPLSPLE